MLRVNVDGVALSRLVGRLWLNIFILEVTCRLQINARKVSPRTG